MDEQKKQLELTKLKLEITHLSKSDFKKPSFTISLAAAIVAIIGVMGQSILSEIRSERITIESLHIQDNMNNLQESIKTKSKQLECTTSELNQIRLALRTAIGDRDQAVTRTNKQRKLAVTALEALKISCEQDTSLRKSISQAKKLLDQLSMLVAEGSESSGLIEEIRTISSKAADFLFPVEARQWSQSGGQGYTLEAARFTSDPPGATVFVIPSKTWSENKLTIDSSVIDLEQWKVGTTSKPLFIRLPSGEGQTYVALFVLEDKRNMDSFRMY